MNLGLISRPRVERQLRDAVEHTPLTLFHAPLGAGKTSAARMAFAQTRGAVWMFARPWHRDAFIRDVVDAVRTQRGDFGRMTLGAVEAGASPTHVGATFARELGHVDQPLLLIFDNVHVFTGEPGFSRFAEAGLSALPPSVRILAMGRALPEISLGGSFARGEAQVIDGDFLAFDADDIRALAARFGRELDAEAIEQIARSTEGWAAGVTLAVTARNMPVPKGAGPRTAAEAYLTKELLSRLDRDLVAFLENTAVFETLDLRVLEGSEAFAGARERIAKLKRGGALLTEIAPGCYRLHQVLRELAGARLRKRDALNQAHRNAAEAYAKAGEIAAALFHANESADRALAASFLRDHAGAAIATGARARVRAVLARIEPAGSDADVRSYVEGLLEKERGSAEVRAIFSRAAEAADATQDNAIAFQARAEVVEHDIGHLVRVADETLNDLARRAEQLGSPAPLATAVLRGWSRAVAHDFSGALAALAPLSETDDTAARFDTDLLRAYAQTALGEIDSAEQTLDALIALLEKGDKVVLQTLTLVWLARLALVWGHTTVAGDAAAQAERLASALDLRAEEAALYVALAEIATHGGDTAAVLRYAEHARNRANQAWYAGDVRRTRAFAEIALARAAFLARDYAIATQLAERAAATADFPPVQRAVALAEAAVYANLPQARASAAVIARARAAIAAASPIDAADAVALATSADLLAFLGAANGDSQSERLPDYAPYAALIQHRRGLVTLEYAGVALANARSGTSEGPTAFETALELLTRDGPRFEAHLLRAYASSFIPARAPQPAIAAFDLTPREHEILALLVDGLTNKEMAQRLIVSSRTVETHVERVLGKLEVGTRSRAIAKAIRLGLVTIDTPVSA